jgi:acetoin utilization deacetylase AcuC-like enzyme
MKRTALVWDDIYKQHLSDAPGHPESPERLTIMYDVIKREGLDKTTTTIPTRMATDKDILLVHDAAYLKRVESSRGEELSAIDPDTWMTAGSYDAAMAAAGSGIALVDAILDGQVDNGYALLRPPGHHAIPSRGMGFCLFNNIAIAAEHLIQRRGVKKIAIIDFDVHHGNGTQASFFGRSDVLYVSTHQSPFFPGTGRFDELGEGEGKGYTVNIPLLPGNGDREFLLIYKHLILPIVEEYQPDFILVSTGYDIHAADPIGGMAVTTQGVTQICKMLFETAEKLCGGRLACFLEGGYNLDVSAACVVPSIQVLQDDLETFAPMNVHIPGSRIRPVLKQVKDALSPYWKCVENLNI